MQFQTQTNYSYHCVLITIIVAKKTPYLNLVHTSKTACFLYSRYLDVHVY